MKNIKIACLWTHDVRSSVFLKLLTKFSKRNLEIASIENADILFIGPYDPMSIKRKSLNFIKKKFPNIDNLFPNIDLYSLKKKSSIKIFYSAENQSSNPHIECDYYISPHLGIENQNHLRFPIWKDYVDWSTEQIFRKNNELNAIRFGSFYRIEDLMKPMGSEFLKKEKKVCFFTSHLTQPRKSMYEQFSTFLNVDGFGPYFDKKIKNHNLSKFKKNEVMKNYAFSLCPHNALYPGYYDEKIPDAFLSNCLPISWADQNIKYDFNPNSFVNLSDYMENNYADICELLKDSTFLKKFTKEPLIKNKPNLEKEIDFAEKILKNI